MIIKRMAQAIRRQDWFAVFNPELAMRRPVEFFGAIVQSSYLYTPVLTAHTFEDLRSTGNIALLRDMDVKNLLYDYYGYEADQRQFEAIWFPQELHHFKLAAGIASLEQERLIQDTWVFFRPDNIEEVRAARADEDEVRATIDRFMARKEFVDWLPQTRSMQQLQIRRNESMLEKARSLHGTLTEYLSSIER